jgi:hypothetical protein
VPKHVGLLKCPTCESPEPRLHPATQAEGEVTHICPDPFHGAAEKEMTREEMFEAGWGDHPDCAAKGCDIPDGYSECRRCGAEAVEFDEEDEN